MTSTLLEIVQEVMSDLDLDEVNSISDTVESEQVARMVKTSYLSLMSSRNWPHLKQLIQLENSGSLALPTHLRMPTGVKELVFLNYNCAGVGETKRVFKPMRWLEPDEFLRKVNARNSDATNIDLIQDSSGVELLIRNDAAPTCYTSFDDEHLVFDSYDATNNSTLIGAKTQVSAYMMPDWVHVDSHTPDLPEEAFIALIEETKSRASLKLNQVQDVKSEAEASSQKRWLSRKAFKAGGKIKRPNYGRHK